MVPYTPARLTWPDGWKRTSEKRRMASGWLHRTNDPRLLAQPVVLALAAIGATSVFVCSDTFFEREVTDPGAAIYFNIAGTRYAYGTDTYWNPLDNLVALGGLAEGLKSAASVGAFEAWARMLSAFLILNGGSHGPHTAPPTQPPPDPPPDPPPRPGDAPYAQWWHVLGFKHQAEATLERAEKVYRDRVKKAHPDLGGSEEAMALFNAAIRAAREHFGK